jgi:hypothetical protein
MRTRPTLKKVSHFALPRSSQGHCAPQRKPAISQTNAERIAKPSRSANNKPLSQENVLLRSPHAEGDLTDFHRARRSKTANEPQGPGIGLAGSLPLLARGRASNHVTVKHAGDSGCVGRPVARCRAAPLLFSAMNLRSQDQRARQYQRGACRGS